jgi:nicotinamide-nucleotide amidase
MKLLAQDLLTVLRGRGWRLAVAESCTGGLLAATLTDIAGASDVFDRGAVVYSNAAKTQMLGVDSATLSKEGAVSEPVARQMAHGMLARSEAQIAVAITGVAGPGASEHKPEGRVCFGLATPAVCAAQTVDFGALGRAEVRREAVVYALALVLAEARRAPATAL